jgi:hypothetical protein
MSLVLGLGLGLDYQERRQWRMNRLGLLWSPLQRELVSHRSRMGSFPSSQDLAGSPERRGGAASQGTLPIVGCSGPNVAVPPSV